MKLEELENFKHIPIDEIDEDTLVDIRTVNIRTDLPPKERMEELLKTMKNPYFFKVGKYIVKATFADENGPTLGECIKELLMMQINKLN